MGCSRTIVAEEFSAGMYQVARVDPDALSSVVASIGKSAGPRPTIRGAGASREPPIHQETPRTASETRRSNASVRCKIFRHRIKVLDTRQRPLLQAGEQFRLDLLYWVAVGDAGAGEVAEGQDHGVFHAVEPPAFDRHDAVALAVDDLLH